MYNGAINVLLVEDNPGDARLMQAMLSDTAGDQFNLRHTKRLDEALVLLEKEKFDVIVLDLGLPDSQGMDTVDHTKKMDPDRPVPIVVVTGVHGEHEGIEALQHGAQDYLVKENLQSDILIRSLRYAVERQRLFELLEEERAKRRQESEIASLEDIESPGASIITARIYGQERLRDAAPDSFDLLVEQYAALIEQALDTRALRADRRVSQGLRILSRRLGFLRASPRDVVEIHSAATKAAGNNARSQRSYILVEEARMLLIEIMGCLAAYYRDHMLPPLRPAADSSATRQDR